MRTRILLLFLVPVLVAEQLHAVAAEPGSLAIVDQGKCQAVIVVDSKAGVREKRAADDLAYYIGLMTGVKPTIANTEEAAATALKGTSPVLVIGSAALRAEPKLQQALDRAAKKNPVLRADAIVLQRQGNRVYLAGMNDDGHYYAVVELLHRWGCRWYLPTEFGECVPAAPSLSVGQLDYVYAPPFEVRSYWLSWNGSTEGQQEFMRRNRMNSGVSVPNGHHPGLPDYTKELVPAGKTIYDIPLADDATADHVVQKVAPLFAKGSDFSLGMEDGVYHSESKLDRELQAGVEDKYMLAPALTDPVMVLYNKVAERLLKQYPQSPSRIGFLAYSNLTLPPQREIVAARPLVAYLAPIDIDPIHGMDDPKSPPRQEYRAMMERWARVMQGRVIIYDYDQGMLVWRDIPNPSIQAIRQDIKHYQKAGILGVATESRGAMATTFLNLHVRGQLMWNPDVDVDALLAEFYEKFYGPAAKPMAAYWGAILAAWEQSIVTEHEHFLVPAIYTPALVATLRKHLEAAEKLVQPLEAKKDAGRNEKLYVQRLKFTRLSFEVIDAYTSMVRAAASEVDYKTAVAAGERGLAARLELAKMNPTFTTRVVGVAAETSKTGPAWWLGEVQQYRELLAYTDGGKGTLLVKTPLEWAFRRDPHDTGLPSGWASQPPDLTWYGSQKDRGSIASHQNNPGYWEMLRTDLYLQAQGVISPDFHSYTGHAWYQTEVDLDTAAVQGKVHLRFPGLFNECWLYVNGNLVDHRIQKPMWWLNDYKFEWDVDLTGKLKPGKNSLTLRIHNPHHFGGIFRRPFLYRPSPSGEEKP